ncbi:DUF764 family protein [Borrelia puertoricensis]|uniref:DUF764 family protein n=1 Tax=Borrelia puertoricensis TaxID=2756107 RepID=UPI001FF3CD54|nr:DUF764 family protein [Borrelia puertoricensis]UPA18617.1 DUF764 family protein [Borrelia puertoricensis]UPA18700.1 DUF764 family protein [Borrelia puertoricensis]UPA18738.1 DUF764 family protein [Borrelia puertoricensis]UPA18855.1 DUF764 family protein [Borrelia puertoricensis]UPA18892.1 DUF764 family protein [Borrelia puertoricensis]
MILSTKDIHKSLISYFKNFKERTSKLALNLDLINTYNHPYMSKYTLECANIIAIKFENMDDLTLGSRAGAFYKNVNEFVLNFQIFILSQVISSKERDAYYTMFQIYSLLSDFIYENTHKVTLQSEDERYLTELNFYIYPTTNMQNSGLVKIDSNYSNAAYCCNQAFKASVQVIEQLIKEEK